MKYKYVIFDVDGTLLDSEYKVFESLNRAIKRGDSQARYYSVHELEATIGMAPDVVFQHLGYGERAAELTRYWEEELIAFSEHEPPHIFAGLEEVIKELYQRGVQLGIATSRILADYRVDARILGIEDYFTEVVCGDQVSKRKPDPEVLLKCAKQFNAPLDQTLYVGDTIYDVQAANACQMPLAIAGWGSRLDPNKINCQYFLKKPEELLAIVFAATDSHNQH